MPINKIAPKQYRQIRNSTGLEMTIKNLTINQLSKCNPKLIMNSTKYTVADSGTS